MQPAVERSLLRLPCKHAQWSKGAERVTGTDLAAILAAVCKHAEPEIAAAGPAYCCTATSLLQQQDSPADGVSVPLPAQHRPAQTSGPALAEAHSHLRPAATTELSASCLASAAVRQQTLTRAAVLVRTVAAAASRRAEHPAAGPAEHWCPESSSAAAEHMKHGSACTVRAEPRKKMRSQYAGTRRLSDES